MEQGRPTHTDTHIYTQRKDRKCGCGATGRDRGFNPTSTPVGSATDWRQQSWYGTRVKVSPINLSQRLTAGKSSTAVSTRLFSGIQAAYADLHALTIDWQFKLSQAKLREKESRGKKRPCVRLASRQMHSTKTMKNHHRLEKERVHISFTSNKRPLAL